MEQARSRAFADVDRAPDPGELVRYLDAVRARPGVSAYKLRSFDELGLEAGMRVLDVGCGTGDDARAIAERIGASGVVVGVDSSNTMVDEARRRGAASPNVRFEQASVDSLPFTRDSFDACRADRVFQ